MSFHTTVYGTTMTEIRTNAEDEVNRFFGDPTPFHIESIAPDEVIRDRAVSGEVAYYTIIYRADITAHTHT